MIVTEFLPRGSLKSLLEQKNMKQILTWNVSETVHFVHFAIQHFPQLFTLNPISFSTQKRRIKFAKDIALGKCAKRQSYAEKRRLNLSLLLLFFAGMAWLHDISHIIHRDLKPANLLLDSQWRIKITGTFLLFHPCFFFFFKFYSCFRFWIQCTKNNGAQCKRKTRRKSTWQRALDEP